MPNNVCEFLWQLNENLTVLRDVSQKYQQAVLDEKLEQEPPEDKLNQYQPGNYVLLYHRGTVMYNKKLLSTFQGPYEVIFPAVT